MFRMLALCGVLLVFEGCALWNRNEASSVPEKAALLVEPDPTPSFVEPLSGGVSRALEMGGVRLRNSDFDIPIVINRDVEHWVDYFTGRGRKHFERYLERGEYFIPYIRALLESKDLPGDLVYLAMIESGFNLQAKSHAKAVGPWQFMAATGRLFGLRVDWWMDERRDIKKSTVAAARYLSHLYRIFGDWALATAAYNAGEYKIARAVQRFGVKDFWVISKSRYLKPETRHYVPKLMAAALIAKNREQFGFPSRYREDEIQEAFLAAREDPLPKEVSEALLGYGWGEALAGPIPAALVLSSSAPLRAQGGGVSLPIFPVIGERGKITGYQIAEVDLVSPADLNKVAKAAGVSLNLIQRLNPEALRWCTSPEIERVRLKIPWESKDDFLLTYNHPSFPREVKFRKIRVRPGDTLGGLARKYGVHHSIVMKLNGIQSARALRVGQDLLLPLADSVYTSKQVEAEIPQQVPQVPNHQSEREAARVRSLNRQRSILQ